MKEWGDPLFSLRKGRAQVKARRQARADGKEQCNAD